MGTHLSKNPSVLTCCRKRKVNSKCNPSCWSPASWGLLSVPLHRCSWSLTSIMLLLRLPRLSLLESPLISWKCCSQLMLEDLSKASSSRRSQGQTVAMMRCTIPSGSTCQILLQQPLQPLLNLQPLPPQPNLPLLPLLLPQPNLPLLPLLPP